MEFPRKARRVTQGSTTRWSAGRVTVPDPNLFPAQSDVRPRPKWFIRLRGFLTLAVLVVGGGVALAATVAILLALIAIISIAFLT